MEFIPIVSDDEDASIPERTYSSLAEEKAAKLRKERFLMHMRILMKYLKQKDPAMYAEAKDIIRECAENKKKKIPGYESATSSMQSRIRALVGNVYWERSKVYLEHFMAMRDLNRLEQN